MSVGTFVEHCLAFALEGLHLVTVKKGTDSSEIHSDFDETHGFLQVSVSVIRLGDLHCHILFCHTRRR